jgi:predicted nucleic acid-binding protein
MTDKQIYDNAIETFIKYKSTIDYSDCIIIESMKKMNVYEILSFDDDFDNKERIVRIF